MSFWRAYAKYIKGKDMIFKRFFKRKYPYAPIAYLGRKTVERALDADIQKFKKLEKEMEKERQQESSN